MEIAGEAKGGNSWLLSTMPAVGREHNANTLNDFKVVVPATGLESIYSVQVFTYGADGQMSGNYVYLDADSNGTDYDCESGWYTTFSIEEEDPVTCGDIAIPFGMGFCVLSDCGAAFNCAGEVINEPKDVKINGEDDGGNTWTGNCSPKDLTLKDFAVTPPKGLTGLESIYSVQVFTYGADGQMSGNYVYLDADSNGTDYDCESGWYTTFSIEEEDPISAGDVEISAGRMFCILSDCGATLTIPSALE